MILEGTSRLLDRDFSLAELLQPCQAKVIEKRFSKDRLVRRVQHLYCE
jgi:hypothetical protein